MCLACRVRIDLNVRTPGNHTFSGFDDIERDPTCVDWQYGCRVTVYEAESGVSGFATHVGIDCEKELIYLAVDWGSIQ